MKRIKELVKSIKEVILASTKSKIIAGSIVGLVVAGSIAGGAYYVYKQNNPTVAGQGKIDETLVNEKEVELTEEEKAYDVKVIKLNSIVESIKELDKEFKLEEEISKDNIDELTKKYNDKRQELLVKKEEENKKEESDKKEEDNKEVAQSGGSSDDTSSGSGQTSTPSGGGSSPSVEEPSKPTPPPTPTPEPKPEPKPEPPKPTKPSGWRQDIADSIVARSTTPNTNCTSGENKVMTPSQLANLNSWAEQWKNGSISGEQFKANAKNDAQSKIEGFSPTYLTRIILVKETYPGDDPSTMFPMGSGHHYLWCRAYYDGSSDTTTVYYISGAMTR